MIQFDEDKQNRKIGDLKKREEEELVQFLSAKYGIEYIDLSITVISSLRRVFDSYRKYNIHKRGR